MTAFYPQGLIRMWRPRLRATTLVRMADDFDELQRRQRNVVTRRQALESGLTKKAILVRLDSGRWQRLHPGVYATFSGPPPRDAALWAAVLRAGHKAALSHQTAAELYGLLDDPAPLIHVTVPSGSRTRRPPGVAIHYSGRLDETTHPALAPPRTRLEDCLLYLAEGADTLDDAAAWILRAIGQRRTTPEKICAAMGRRARLRWRSDIADVLGVAAEGAQSLLEYRYVTRVERPHGLPRGARQRRVVRDGRNQYQDVSYEECQVVVELDGQRAHPLGARLADARRDNANTVRGWATIRLGYLDVSARPCVSADVVGRSLQRRGWSGALRRCGPACELPIQ